ncbi:MAG TPA: DUF2550 domain-containing protein [Propionibacteriaceae bacterium]|jgi:hypothetical protein|nr:DUF2550 domain-containing protein [Propionibacteriaceae bacterium]
MPGWLNVVSILVACVLLIALSLVVLALRQRWLNRLGGNFECSLRVRVTTPGAGWVLGVCRYSEGILEWFRFFSYSPRPRMRFSRSELRVLETRDPDPVEAVALSSDQTVVRVASPGHPGEVIELAMSADSLTGLLSWLEAAPPGVRRFDS